MRLPTLADLERLLILKRMEELDGNKRAVARSLGIALWTLQKRLNAYGAPPPKPPEPDYSLHEFTRAELAIVLDAFAREYQEKS